MNELRSWSLTNTTATVIILTVLWAATLYALLGLLRPRTRKATLWTLPVAVLLGVAVWFVLEVAWRPFPDHVPLALYAAGVAAVVVVLGAVFQPGRRLRLFVPGVAALLAAAGVGNLIYQQYPTLGSLDPTPVTVAMTYQEFQQATTTPQIDGRDVGALVTVPLQGTSSGFPARDAVAYVPPVYWTDPQVQLPVLVLMAGNPGEPGQWFSAGDGQHTADAYQQDHGGRTPLIISVDGTGSFSGNPGCVDGPDLQVDTYLGTDVPQLIREKFRVNPNQHTWTIGGLSYGGTCALQIITNHPQSYGGFLDFSGQAEPSLGSHDKTVQQLFGSDEQAFRAVNPADLLTAARGTDTYSHLWGRFFAGENDQHAIDALTHLHDLATAAGIDSSFSTVPGGHSYEVWREALRQTLDDVARHGGLNS